MQTKINPKKNKILVVEDDLGLREAVVDTLLLAGYQCFEANHGIDALALLSHQPVDLIISDVQMAQMDGIALLKNLRKKGSTLPIILMTAHGSIDAAVEAMRYGASDYLSKPFVPQLLLAQIARYLESDVTLDDAPEQGPVVGDPSSLQLLTLAARVAKSEVSVMVLGPSGSGKEVLARYIHQHSPRAKQPFVAINCAAIPENMLEATLFGYEKGAFTGAVNACPGKFEQAQHGTILLDEITEMDLNLQAKLLRVLQEREVERLGSRKTIKLDVRVLATSNRDLAQAVAAGAFREDLYYRLNVFPLAWPALAKRPGDIIPLAQHLLLRHGQRQSGTAPQLSEQAQQRLLQHSWPGNVRELDNVMQRALILAQGDHIEAQDLFLDGTLTPLALQEPWSPPAPTVAPLPLEQWLDEGPSGAVLEPNVAEKPAPPSALSHPAEAGAATATLANSDPASGLSQGLSQDLKHTEFQMIADSLRLHRGSRKAVAEQLGLSPRTLRYKLAKMRDAGYEIPV
ncbi:MAG: sigma-54 dependent transcriptional regulator [Ferrimonas sp.]